MVVGSSTLARLDARARPRTLAQDIAEISSTMHGGGGGTLMIVAGVGLAMNVFGAVIFGHSGFGHGHSHGGGGHGHAHGGGGDDGEDHGHSHGHSHSGGEDHGHSHGGGGAAKPKRKAMNLNVRGIMLHMIGDALGSVGALISGAVIYFGESLGPNRFVVDPLCSLSIVAIILLGTVPLVRRCIGVLLQGAPSEVNIVDLRARLMKVTGVFDVHGARARVQLCLCAPRFVPPVRAPMRQHVRTPSPCRRRSARVAVERCETRGVRSRRVRERH
jgi:zinc transporter 5/7